MSKKTTETKPENQAEKNQPTELNDEQTDEVQGGNSALRGIGSTRPSVTITNTGDVDLTNVVVSDDLAP